MSGRRIDDHKFFAGSGSPKFPKGVHTKDESSAEGSGAVMRYEDTTEMIKSQQEKSVSQAKKHPMKPGYRY
jgi:hypothetical protein